MTPRESRTHPLTRTSFVLCAVIFASCLATASDDTSSSRACAALTGPTNFDYLVLASIADSPRFLAMAGYRKIAMQGAELPPGAAPMAVSYGKAVAPCVDHVLPRLSSRGS